MIEVALAQLLLSPALLIGGVIGALFGLIISLVLFSQIDIQLVSISTITIAVSPALSHYWQNKNNHD